MIKKYFLRLFEVKVRICSVTGRVYRKGELCECYAKNFGQEIDESKCSRSYFYNLLTRTIRELRI